MRVGAVERHELPLRIVLDVNIGRRFMAALAELNPEYRGRHHRFVETGRGPRAQGARGARRAGGRRPHGRSPPRPASARCREFPRQPAEFPAGPWLLAAALQGAGGDRVRHLARRLTATRRTCELLAEKIELPRADARSGAHATRAGLRGSAGGACARAHPTIGSTSSTSGRDETARDLLLHGDERSRARSRRAHRRAARGTHRPRRTTLRRRARCRAGSARSRDSSRSRCRASSRPAIAATTGSRNSRSAQDGFLDAVAAARARYGARRIGVFIGTSTSGVRQTELAYRDRAARGAERHCPTGSTTATTQSTFSIADYTRTRLGLEGIASAVSAACASSAKVFASAARAIEAGFCDAAVVGGVDSLCLTTLYGFNALQLVSPEICRPADAEPQGPVDRRGGRFRAARARARAGRRRLSRRAANRAMRITCRSRGPMARARCSRCAARSARWRRSASSYINLHGTATPANDAAEDTAVTRVVRHAQCRAAPPRAGPDTRSAPRALSRRRSRCSRSSTASCRAASIHATLDPKISRRACCWRRAPARSTTCCRTRSVSAARTAVCCSDRRHDGRLRRIKAVGIAAPGLTGWDASLDVLRGVTAVRARPPKRPTRPRCCRRTSGAARPPRCARHFAPPRMP